MKSEGLLQRSVKFLGHSVFTGFLLNGFVLTCITEAFNRQSVAGMLRFMAGSPLAFLCNMFIISLTLCLSLLVVRRRYFVQAFISLVWIVMGAANCIILTYRMTPFSAEDFSLLPMLARIVKNYMTPGLIFTVAAVIVSLLIGTVVLWFRLPKDMSAKTSMRSLRLNILKTACMVLALSFSLNMGMKTQALSQDFKNLADAYEEYGFAYCFSNSVVDKGIAKPELYSEEMMDIIVSGMENTPSAACGVTADETVKTTSADAESADSLYPDIIMIQLESFFDPMYIKGFTYSHDPVPFFRHLKEEETSGFLTVPVVGAGTANTEFECLTGMSTSFFGAGEYPYNTVLSEQTCESLAYILGDHGYATSAVHNNTGTFYNRNTVFSNMGFDNFIPEEYMYGIERTYTNWAKDAVLTDVIMDRLDITDAQDFIYTITVQSHGRYPQEEARSDPYITVTPDIEFYDENYNVYPLEYYVNQICEVDQFTEELIGRLEERGAPAMVIMYGDHLPALGFDEDDLTLPSLYSTEYVIWDNFGFDMQDTDLEAEQLGTRILTELGIDGGMIPAFHRAYDGTSEYEEYLELVEYDMFYGKGYIFEDGTRREPTDLTFGTRAITAEGCSVDEDGTLTVYGSGFNESSKITIDGKIYDTVFEDEETITLEGRFPSGAEKICVMQCDSNLEPLGRGSNEIDAPGA